MKHHWYALEVTSSKTTDARDALMERGFHAYIPWEFRWKRRVNRKRYKSAVPIMPGYVFAKLPNPPDWPTVLRTDYVHRAVAFGDQPPIVISDKVMDYVQALTPEKVYKITMNHSRDLKIGMHAEIADGPYASHTGKITEMSDKRSRVLLYVLGSWREIDVPSDSLEAA